MPSTSTCGASSSRSSHGSKRRGIERFFRSSAVVLQGEGRGQGGGGGGAGAGASSSGPSDVVIIDLFDDEDADEIAMLGDAMAVEDVDETAASNADTEPLEEGVGEQEQGGRGETEDVQDKGGEGATGAGASASEDVLMIDLTSSPQTDAPEGAGAGAGAGTGAHAGDQIRLNTLFALQREASGRKGAGGR
jgi:hypothetical protein